MDSLFFSFLPFLFFARMKHSITKIHDHIPEGPSVDALFDLAWLDEEALFLFLVWGGLNLVTGAANARTIILASFSCFIDAIWKIILFPFSVNNDENMVYRHQIQAIDVPHIYIIIAKGKNLDKPCQTYILKFAVMK